MSRCSSNCSKTISLNCNKNSELIFQYKKVLEIAVTTTKLQVGQHRINIYFTVRITNISEQLCLAHQREYAVSKHSGNRFKHDEPILR